MGGSISFQAPEQLSAISTIYSTTSADPADFSTSYAWAPQATEFFGVLGTVTLSSTALNSLQPYLIFPTGTGVSDTTRVTCSPFPATTATITTSILCPVPVTKIQPGVATIAISPIVTSTTPSPFTTSFAFKVASISYAQAQTTTTLTSYVTDTTTLTTRTVTDDKVAATATITSATTLTGASTTVYTTCTPRTTLSTKTTSSKCKSTFSPPPYCNNGGYNGPKCPVGHSDDCSCFNDGGKWRETKSEDALAKRDVQVSNDCPGNDPPCKKEPYLGCGKKCGGGTACSAAPASTSSAAAIGKRQNVNPDLLRWIEDHVPFEYGIDVENPRDSVDSLAAEEDQATRLAQVTGFIPPQFTFSNEGSAPTITATNTVTKYETRYTTITVSTGTVTVTRAVTVSTLLSTTVDKRTKATVSVDCSKTITKGSGVALTTTVVPV